MVMMTMMSLIVVLTMTTMDDDDGDDNDESLMMMIILMIILVVYRNQWWWWWWWVVQEQHHLSFCVVCPAPVGLYRAALIPLTLQHYARTTLYIQRLSIHTVLSEHNGTLYISHSCRQFTLSLQSTQTIEYTIFSTIRLSITIPPGDIHPSVPLIALRCYVHPQMGYSQYTCYAYLCRF